MDSNWEKKQRDRLEQKKAELSDRVSKIEADIGKGLDADLEEQATQLENQEVLAELVKEAQGQLPQINGALARMADGSYGRCGVCGKQINIQRLEANPYANDCMSCASAR